MLKREEERVNLFGIFRKKKTVIPLEQRYRVTFNDRKVECTLPDGGKESVEWTDLKAILLENTDEGPFLPDVFWILVGEKGGCLFPQGAIGEMELLAEIQKLPGFDNNAVIESATCTDNRKFLCWTKSTQGSVMN